MIQLAAEVGGTFTDLIWTDGKGRLHTHKVPSTPSDPSLAVIRGTDESLGDELPQLRRLFHGSTVATNAVLERKGGRTALVTTRGFKDILARGARSRDHQRKLDPREPPGGDGVYHSLGLHHPSREQDGPRAVCFRVEVETMHERRHDVHPLLVEAGVDEFPLHVMGEDDDAISGESFESFLRQSVDRERPGPARPIASSHRRAPPRAPRSDRAIDAG